MVSLSASSLAPQTHMKGPTWKQSGHFKPSFHLILLKHPQIFCRLFPRNASSIPSLPNQHLFHPSCVSFHLCPALCFDLSWSAALRRLFVRGHNGAIHITSGDADGNFLKGAQGCTTWRSRGRGRIETDGPRPRRSREGGEVKFPGNFSAEA